MKKLILLIICVILLTNNIFAQWSDNSVENLQMTNVGEVGGFAISNLSDGSYYVYYESPSDASYELIRKYLQRYDANGIKMWDNDLLVSDNPTLTWTQINQDMFTDKDDNAIVIISDIRYNVEGFGLSYSIYKISPDGEQLWGEDGVALTPNETFGLISAIQATQLLDGSYVFAWQDYYEGKSGFSEYTGGLFQSPQKGEQKSLTNQENSTNNRIRLQRLSGDGEIMWDEKKTISADAADVTTPQVIDAGNNDFFVAFAQGANQALYVRKLDFDANPIWGTDTKIYDGGGFSVAPLWTILRSAPADGGILVGWNDDRDGDRLENLYCAYIESDGTHAFSAGEGGQKISYAPYMRAFNISMAFDKPNSCIFISWRETSAGQTWQRIVTQKISLDGNILWQPEGIEVGKLEEMAVAYNSTQLGVKNTVCTFFMKNRVNYGVTEVLATLQNPDGSFVWADTTVVLSNSKSSKGSLLSTTLANNQWVCIWEDGSVDASNVYGQNIGINGTLGAGATSNEYVKFATNSDIQVILYPNPVIDVANIEITNNINFNIYINVEVIDISGRRVKSIFNGNAPSGKSLLEYKVEGLKSGLYFIKVTSGKGVHLSKFVVK